MLAQPESGSDAVDSGRISVDQELRITATDVSSPQTTSRRLQLHLQVADLPLPIVKHHH